MTQTADAIVVGGGLEGLSTAYHLATAGYGRVTVFERALLCSGGTAKSSGVVCRRSSSRVVARTA